MQDATQQLIANINQLAANIQAGKTADKNYQAIKDTNEKNLQAVQETNDMNYKIAMETNLLNRQWSLEDWNRQVAYNDPAYQKQLYAASGYRYQPNQSGLTAPAVNTPTAQASSMQPMVYQPEMFDPNNNLPTTMLNGISLVNNAYVGANQVEQMRHQNDLIDVQGLQAHQIIKNLASEILGQDLQNWITDHTKDMSVENANLMNQHIQSQISQTQTYLNQLDRQTRLLDLQLSFNPQLYTHLKNLWKSEETSAQCKASLDRFLLGQHYKWDDKESEARYKQLLANSDKLLEEIRVSKQFNSDEMYNIAVEYGRNQNSLILQQALHEFEINDATVYYDGKKMSAVRYTTLEQASQARQQSIMMQYNNMVLKPNASFERQGWFVGINHAADFLSKMIGPAFMGRAMYNMYNVPQTPKMSGGIAPQP